MDTGLGPRWVRTRPRDDSHAPNERGFTLIETVVTVLLLGIISSTFGIALITLERSSDQQRRASLVDAELRRYADWVDAHDYANCADASKYPYQPSDPQTFTVTPPTIAFTGQDIRHNVAGSYDFNWNKTDCDAHGDNGVQQITLGIAAAGDATPSTLVMIKQAP